MSADTWNRKIPQRRACRKSGHHVDKKSFPVWTAVIWSFEVSKYLAKRGRYSDTARAASVSVTMSEKIGNSQEALRDGDTRSICAAPGT